MNLDILDLLLDVLKNSLLITGLVVVMMMMIEYVNVSSSGKLFNKLRTSKPRQVLLGSILGLIPGCMGGFASVSLFSHGLISFGALVATMICSSGDESFVMLAMIPREALILFAILFVISFVSGLVVDKVYKGDKIKIHCDQEFEIHSEHHHVEKLPSLFKSSSYKVLCNPSKERIILIIGLLLFIVALFTGILDHEHTEEGHIHSGINLLDERWMNILFASLSVIVLFLTASAPNHFIKEHIWNHVIKKHCLSIFLWTSGALAVIQIGLYFVDIQPWLSENTFYVILLAALIGMIPESGPHLAFVTLFAGGYVPFSVLLASSISQDGHTTLPLLASDKRSFIRAKLINALLAVVIGCIFMWFGL
jgi:hypothetical protein